MAKLERTSKCCSNRVQIKSLKQLIQNYKMSTAVCGPLQAKYETLFVNFFPFFPWLVAALKLCSTPDVHLLTKKQLRYIFDIFQNLDKLRPSKEFVDTRFKKIKY